MPASPGDACSTSRGLIPDSIQSAETVAALHVGTITVSNGEEGGSLFVIELPLSNGA